MVKKNIRSGSCKRYMFDSRQRELSFAFNYLIICPRPDYNIMCLMHLIYDNSFHVSMNPLAFVRRRFTLMHAHAGASASVWMQMEKNLKIHTGGCSKVGFVLCKNLIYFKKHAN